MTRRDEAMYLLRFFNANTGYACRMGGEAREKIVVDAIERGSIADIQEHIKAYIAESKANGTSIDFIDCMRTYKGIEKEAEKVVVEEQKMENVSANAVSYSLGILEQAVVGMIAKTQTERIENEIGEQIKTYFRDYIESEYGSVTRNITTLIDGKKADVKGITHEEFETVLKFVANDEPVFLTGPAGSGKNVLCKQIADALGLKFYFTNAVTQEYKLTGFTDAMGKYQETQFYKAFTQGGVFMLDEMDASIPEVLVILNAAIANRYFDFPAPIGYVEAHPDFRVIAAGNTTGHGADFNYVGRNQLDAASLDRFAIVRIDYSPSIENSVAGDIEIADFCRDFRRAAEEAGVQVIVSYRAIGRLAKMLHILSVRKALETCLLKGLEKDDVNMIVGKMHVDGKYTSELRRMVA